MEEYSAGLQIKASGTKCLKYHSTTNSPAPGQNGWCSNLASLLAAIQCPTTDNGSLCWVCQAGKANVMLGFWLGSDKL